MRFLLDTHALLWVARNRGELSARARDLLSEDSHSWYISAVSAWEIATKHRIGKLPDAGLLLGEFDRKIAAAGYKILSITCEHGLLAGSFPHGHQDPFDRLLAAQCLIDDLALLSNDKALDVFGIKRFW